MTGNIPAYAGKTYESHIILPHLKEHPRVCGENGCRFGECPMLGGTSPRMRGKLITQILSMLLHRNIPAYAGKTCKRDA